MNLEDISIGRRTEYRKTCPICMIETLILSQRDDFAEYETDIYVECCGDYLEFILPVN